MLRQCAILMEAMADNRMLSNVVHNVLYNVRLFETRANKKKKKSHLQANYT